MADPFITVGGALLGGGALGALGKALFDYLGQRNARHEDQDDAIRGELWSQVKVLQGQVQEMQGKMSECERRGLFLQGELYKRDTHIMFLRLRLEQAGISLGDIPGAGGTGEIALTPFTATIVPTVATAPTPPPNEPTAAAPA